jgi:hypothetical protein
VPKPGYLELVLAAARDLDLPAAYRRNLSRFTPSGWRVRRAPATG